ncbi:unnamed protein product, partial [Amoebophrya sp. A120]
NEDENILALRDEQYQEAHEDSLSLLFSADFFRRRRKQEVHAEVVDHGTTRSALSHNANVFIEVVRHVMDYGRHHGLLKMNKATRIGDSSSSAGIAAPSTTWAQLAIGRLAGPGEEDVAVEQDTATHYDSDSPHRLHDHRQDSPSWPVFGLLSAIMARYASTATVMLHTNLKTALAVSSLQEEPAKSLDRKAGVAFQYPLTHLTWNTYGFHHHAKTTPGDEDGGSSENSLDSDSDSSTSSDLHFTNKMGATTSSGAPSSSLAGQGNRDQQGTANDRSVSEKVDFWPTWTELHDGIVREFEQDVAGGEQADHDRGLRQGHGIKTSEDISVGR